MGEIKIYKLRDSENGLYSTGGYNPKWNNRGKSWNNLGAVKNHINSWCNASYGKLRMAPDSWEIVELIITEEDVNTWSVNDHINEVKRLRDIHEKYGYQIYNALRAFKDLDTSIYRYLFVFGWDTLDLVVKDLKNLDIKRASYRYRTPALILNNIDDAFVVKLAHGESVQTFIDLVELKDLD